jgi:replicative DNA helicase
MKPVRRDIRPYMQIGQEAGQLPPQAPEMEQAVLGSILLDQRALSEVSDFLEPEHFYVTVHSTIYKSLLRLRKADAPINILTVAQSLKESSELDIIGGAFYLSQLTAKVSGSAGIQYNARVILQKFIRRELIRVSAETLSNAYDESRDEFDLLDEHNEGVGRINAITTNADPVSAGQIIGNMVDNTAQPLYMHFGMGDLDKHVAMGPGCVTVVGARPAVGKTTFVVNGLMNMARAGKASLFLSLEMSAEQLTAKISSALTGIDSERITRNDINDDERAQIAQSAAHNGVWIPRILIHDMASLKASQVFGLFERAVKRHKCEVVVIDYLQLMDGEGDNGAERMANISKACKQAAKASKIRLIEVSQLKRRDGADVNPEMSDLRESGQIEADGDIIILLGRKPGAPEMLAKIVKNKIGPIGNVQLPFNLVSQNIGTTPRYDIKAGLPHPDNYIEPTPTDEAPF